MNITILMELKMITDTEIKTYDLKKYSLFDYFIFEKLRKDTF